ncbi:general negative regulator of transcription subunit 5 [Coemansia sp. RSA 1813]|nr:general negative regulator of transcription subunit 5 [Coemansia sp. RSA 1646]KAJ2088334.1 general negative regulator of transcription subunit 5 [Coemansia sp. RSA 986]KAJ2213327.1 general negative regulator of transcription subunit 5 [Coemansia sp. RSA 487]KAJ2568188.1 general negative regulator of transcription subunit 5 [Coemansia sp. RSA 1813]
MSRKLLAEIERVFKKVAEGIEDFEDCYDKVLNASNASQKEKYETDLKKEIKKLQRLRDQIKTWIQSNDIKDKQDLLHHRKLIEKQMEKFKAIEKEMKTKAYSKEGLLQSTKLDPKEKEKLDLCNWLVDSVDSLSTQIDVLEATAETIEGAMGKKRRDANKVDRLHRLQERVDRHKFHIGRLERIQRLLENESLSAEQVQRIQEDVNYYVDQNNDEEFMEDEFIYDDLPLDDDDALFAIPGDDDAFNNDDQDTSDEEDIPTTKEASAEPEPLSAGRSVLGGKSAKAPRASPGLSSAPPTTTAISSVTIVPHHPTTLPPAPVESKNAWADVKESVLSPSRPGTTTGTSSANAQSQPQSSALAQPWAAVAGQNTAGASPSLVSPISTDASAKNSELAVVGVPEPSESTVTKTIAAPVPQKKTANESLAIAPSQEQQASTNVGQGAAVNGTTDAGTQGEAKAAALSRASTSPVGTKRPSADEQQQHQPAMQRPKYFTLFQDSEVPDAFADLMATFMKAKHQFSANHEGVRNLQRQMVDLSLQGIPSLLDQERPKTAPKTQVNTPGYYPQTALPVIEHPGMAAHLDLDTLFFAFYYQPSTYQQYLAAKELNRQSWRFHKKYLTWFQRYEEPSDITDDYEQGTYIYFDYEGAWCQRKKSEFRFEYKYLEDTELA